MCTDTHCDGQGRTASDDEAAAQEAASHIVRLANALHNQRNEVVLEGMHVLMLKRRGTAK